MHHYLEIACTFYVCFNKDLIRKLLYEYLLSTGCLKESGKHFHLFPHLQIIWSFVLILNPELGIWEWVSGTLNFANYFFKGVMNSRLTRHHSLNSGACCVCTLCQLAVYAAAPATYSMSSLEDLIVTERMATGSDQ